MTENLNSSASCSKNGQSFCEPGPLVVKNQTPIYNMVDTRLIDTRATFSSFSHLLDSRILRALADMGFARPTLVQMQAIPIALENRDILARARTGSGKTAAYCIPVLQKILSAKVVSPVCTCSRPL